MFRRHLWWFKVVVVCLLIGYLEPLSLCFGQSEDLVEVTEDVSTNLKEIGAAKKQLSRDAVQKATLRFLNDILGSDKVEAQKSALQTRVINQSARFIPLIRQGEPSVSNSEIRMKFTLSVSAASLKELLRKEGFLKTADDPVLAVPFISLADNLRAKSISWWKGNADVENDDFLKGQLMSLTLKLRDEVAHAGVGVINPLTWSNYELLPKDLVKDSYSSEELSQLGRVFRAGVVLRGTVTLAQSPNNAGMMRAELRLLAQQVSTGRGLAEVSQTAEFISGSLDAVVAPHLKQLYEEAAKDLTAQLEEIWQRGALSSVVIRLGVRGDLGPQDLESFKGQFLKSVHSARSMKERSFERGVVVFEVEHMPSTKPLGDQISASTWGEGIQVQVASAAKEEIWLTVHKTKK